MLRLLFVVSILGIGLVAAVRSRFGALLLYLWFAMFRPLEWVYVNLSSLRLSLVIALLLVVPCLLTGVFPNLTHPLSWGALWMLLLSLIAQASAPRPDIGWLWIDYFWRVIIVALLATTLVNTRRRMTWTIAVIAGAWAMHAGKAGLMAVFEGGVQYAAGLAGAFSDNNDYALGIAMTIPLMVGAAQNLDKTQLIDRWFGRALFIAVPFSALTVISTMSRGGFLALATGGLVFLGLQRRRFLAFSVVGLLLLVALPFVPLPEGYTERLSTIQTYETEGEASALSRLHFWQVAMRMVADNPLGVGLKNYEASYDRYDTSGAFGSARAVHSSHFQALAELGYAGFAVWVLMFAYALFLLLRIRRRFVALATTAPEISRFYVTMSIALITSMVSFLVGGSFLALLLNDLTWTCFALVAALDRLAKQEVVVAQPAASPPADALAFSRGPRPPRVAASF